jgi:hypothetical protein
MKPHISTQTGSNSCRTAEALANRERRKKNPDSECKIKEEELERHHDEKLCFGCGESGNFSRNCPK